MVIQNPKQQRCNEIMASVAMAIRQKAPKRHCKKTVILQDREISHKASWLKNVKIFLMIHVWRFRAYFKYYSI